MLSPLKRINFNSQAKVESSRLYSLSPIGLGTPMVESLSSYIIRLAEAHCVTVGVLIAQEISPLLRKKYLTPARSRKVNSGSMLGVIRSIESTGETAVAWTQALGKLTFRPNLHLLTMLPFKQLFSTRNLLRDKRVWCPSCFEALKINKEITYESLLWRLEAVIFCPVHKVRLERICNNCHKEKQPILASSVRAGFCYYCKQWLGYLETPRDWSDENVQISISKSISRVLAESQDITSLQMKRNIATNIDVCINHFADGKISRFVRLINTSPRIINNWRNRTNLFRLDLLAQICLKLTLPFEQLVMSNIINPNILKKRDFSPLPRKSHGKRVIDLTAMRQLLEVAIEKKSNVPSLKQLAENFGHDVGCFKRHFPDLCSQLKEHYNNHKEIERHNFWAKIISALNEYPPPSVAALSRRVNRCIPTLYNLFPTLCQEITRNHKAYKEKLRKAQLLLISEEIRQIAFELHKNGIYPSQKQVGWLMTKPGRISNKPASDILRKIQQILSIPTD
ncbi:MAG: TniQ family protein [Pyrinomonadaceae bacterium]